MRNRTTLTSRGLAILITGALAVSAAAFLGEFDLIWLGLSLTVLPLAALLYLLLLRPKVSYRRRLEPPIIEVGNSVRVVLHATNHTPLQGSAIRFTDTFSDSIGGGASFVIARGFGRWRQAVGYTIDADRRGRFIIGPLRGVAADPLALAQCRLTAAGETNTLRVTPRVWPLDELAGGSGMGTASDATPQRIGQAGQDDVLVREHRHGDDIRRIHWKMSAKQGELMVRLEEHPWDPSSTLFVDTRASAHRGEGPTSSLEWAISAVTSVAARLVEGRNRVTILAPAGVMFETGHLVGDTARRTMIEAMTDLRSSDEERVSLGTTEEETLSATVALIAVTGLLTPADATVLAAAGSRARQHIALVPDAAAWGADPKPHSDACSLLRSRGWQVTMYRPQQPLPEVWGYVT